MENQPIKTNIFGIPFDIIVAVIGLIGEVVKLFTPNHVSQFQKTNKNDTKL